MHFEFVTVPVAAVAVSFVTVIVRYTHGLCGVACMCSPGVAISMCFVELFCALNICGGVMRECVSEKSEQGSACVDVGGE
jgi:hypothetical protein